MFGIKKGARHRKRRILTHFGALAAATTLVTGGFVVASQATDKTPASAHTWNNTATCKALTTDNTAYSVGNGKNKVNHITVKIDGKVVEDTNFGSSFKKSYDFSDFVTAHSWSVIVKAWDSKNYSYTESGTSTPCAPTPVPANPQSSDQVVCGAATLTFTNPITVGKDEVGTNAEFSYTDTNGAIQYVTVKPNETKSVTVSFPEDSGDKTVTFGVKGGTQKTVHVPTDCQPNTVPNNPQVEKQLDCGVITFTVTNPVTLGEHDVADNANFTYTDTDGTLQTVSVKPNETKVIAVQFPEDSGDKTVTYGFAGQDQQTLTVETDCQPNKVPSNGKLNAQKDCGVVTLTGTNIVELGKNDVADDATFTYTDANGDTQEFTVKPNETKTVTIQFPEDSGDKTVTFGVKGGEQQTLTVETDCQPNPPVVTKITPLNIVFNDACGTSDDGYTVPGEPIASNNKDYKFSSKVVDGTYYWNQTLEKNKDGIVVLKSFDGGIFVPDDGYAVNEPSSDSFYKLVDGVAVYGSYSYDDEACATTPPTSTPTPTPTPSDTPKPSTTPTPTKTPVPAAVSHVNGPTNGQLAFTGSPVNLGLMGGVAALALLVGVSFIILKRRRQTTQMGSEQE